VKRRRRGSGGSGDHGEVVGEAASLISSCRGVTVWLEVRPRSGRAEHGGIHRAGAKFRNGALTRGAEGRGDLGGKVCRDEKHWNYGYCSSEFRLADSEIRLASGSMI
jgi:hypothetical protein